MTKQKKLAALTTIPLFILGTSAFGGLTFATIATINSINNDGVNAAGSLPLSRVIGETEFRVENKFNFSGIPDGKSILSMIKANSDNETLRVNGVQVTEIKPSTETDATNNDYQATISPATNVSIYSGSVTVYFNVNVDKPSLESIIASGSDDNIYNMTPNNDWLTTAPTEVDVLLYFCNNFFFDEAGVPTLRPNQIEILSSSVITAGSSHVDIDARANSPIYSPNDNGPVQLAFDLTPLPSAQFTSNLFITTYLDTFNETPNIQEVVSAIQTQNRLGATGALADFCNIDILDMNLETYFDIEITPVIEPDSSENFDIDVTLKKDLVGESYVFTASETPVNFSCFIAPRIDISNSSYIPNGDISSEINVSEAVTSADIQTAAYTIAYNNNIGIGMDNFFDNTEVVSIDSTNKSCLLKATDVSYILTGQIALTWDGNNGFKADGTNWPGYVNGSLNITSSGSIGVSPTYAANNLVIPNSVLYTDPVSEEIVPLNINKLGSACFANCELFGTTYIGNNVTSIESNAFMATTTNLVFTNDVDHPLNLAQYSLGWLGYSEPVSITLTPGVNINNENTFMTALGDKSNISTFTFNGFNSLPNYYAANSFANINSSGTISSINGSIPSTDILEYLKTNCGLPSAWTAI